jgi:hypothetical protein
MMPVVPLVHHPAFDAERRSPRICVAHAFLPGTDDTVVIVDPDGFDPAECTGRSFSGLPPHAAHL